MRSFPPDIKEEEVSTTPGFNEDTVIPYTEKPANNRYVRFNSTEISADSLFSLFTAEVIKEDTEFSR